MRNSTSVIGYQRAVGRCEAAEGIGRTHRGAVRPKGKRVEAERDSPLKEGDMRRKRQVSCRVRACLKGRE